MNMVSGNLLSFNEVFCSECQITSRSKEIICLQKEGEMKVVKLVIEHVSPKVIV